MKKTLTPFQEKFVLLYHQTSNGSQSYKDSYGDVKDTTARRNAHRLLSQDHIKARLKELQDEASKKFKVKTEDLIRLNVEIAFSKLSDVIKITDDGDIEIIPDGDIDSLDGISFSKSESQGKEGFSSSKSISVKRPDRVKAAQELAKLIGSYGDISDDKDSKKSAAIKLLESLAKFKNNKKTVTDER